MFKTIAQILTQFRVNRTAHSTVPKFRAMPPPQYSRAASECVILASQGRLADAEAACQRHLARTPDDGGAWDVLGMILFAVRRYDDGLQAMARALQCSATAPQYFEHYVVSLAKCYKHQDAERIATAAYEKWPDISDIALIYAQCLASCFKGDAARAIFERLVLADPSNEKYWTHYAHSMLSVGFTGDVLRACERAVALNASNYYSVGLMYFRTLMASGRAAEAGNIHRICIELLRTSDQTIVKAIDWVERYEGAVAAEPLWRDYEAKNSRAALAVFRMAENLALQERWPEASRLLDTAATLPSAGGLKLQINALRRSATDFVPAIKQLITAPINRRQPLRKETVIVIRGAVEARFLDIVKHYGVKHTDQHIVLSTWEDTSPELLSALRPYVDDIVLNARPARPGMNNLNYQIVCAAAGIKKAKERGASNIFLTRTDLTFLKPDILEDFADTLTKDQPDLARTPRLKKRLIICDLYSLTLPLYHVSDIFCYGTADDVESLWSPAGITDSCLRPEVTLGRGLAAKIGRPLLNSMDDSLQFFRDAFIVRDAESLKMFWQKYPSAIRSNLVDPRPYVSERVWSGRDELDLYATIV